MRYVHHPLDWHEISLMKFSNKYVGQPTLYLSEGILFEMQLNIGMHRVKPTMKPPKRYNWFVLMWSGIYLRSIHSNQPSEGWQRSKCCFIWKKPKLHGR